MLGDRSRHNQDGRNDAYITDGVHGKDAMMCLRATGPASHHQTIMPNISTSHICVSYCFLHAMANKTEQNASSTFILGAPHQPSPSPLHPSVFQGCSGGVPGMFQGCSGVVPGLFQGCSGSVPGVFQGCSRDVLGVFRGCSGLILVPRVLKGIKIKDSEDPNYEPPEKNVLNPDMA